MRKILDCENWDRKAGRLPREDCWGPLENDRIERVSKWRVAHDVAFYDARGSVRRMARQKRCEIERRAIASHVEDLRVANGERLAQPRRFGRYHMLNAENDSFCLNAPISRWETELTKCDKELYNLGEYCRHDLRAHLISHRA